MRAKLTPEQQEKRAFARLKRLFPPATRVKRTPEARLAAKEKANERAEAHLKRQAAKASTWEGFAAFMATYDPPPALSPSYEAMGVIWARGAWESARPSQRMRVAILLMLQRVPAITLDAKTGRRLSAGEWLMRLWPGPSGEDLRKLIDGTLEFETPAQAEAAALRRLGAMVEAAEGGA